MASDRVGKVSIWILLCPTSTSKLLRECQSYSEHEFQLVQYLKEYDEISRRQYQELLSHNSARETLLYLVDIGILKREIRKGDTTAYFSLNIE